MLCLSGFEPYSRWVPLPNHFVVGYRIFEVRTWYLHSLLLYWKSLVRFLPHLIMDKYHVLSMKYFVDVTLFVPK